MFCSSLWFVFYIGVMKYLGLINYFCLWFILCRCCAINGNNSDRI